ncbi:hypothetical protein HDU98_000391 [Podochytrium sp. JEL0797]|nr:hypothetical protein HDU98_000391 [Podochytrium sp. JEL0797]
MNKPSPLALCVYGAGLVGCYVGSLVAAHGHKVALVTRARFGAALSTRGCISATKHFPSKATFEVPKEQLFLPQSLLAMKELGQAPKVLLVTMKRGAVEGAINELREASFSEDSKERDGDAWFWKDTLVVMMQNGISPSKIVLDSLGSSLNVIDGMFPFNVTHGEHNDPTHFEQGSSGLLYVSDTPQGRDFAQLLTDSGIECHTSADMQAIQYGKLMLNLNNAICALSATTLKKELAQFEYRNILAMNMKECLSVLAAAEIQPLSFTSLPISYVATVMGAPDFVFNCISGFVVKVSESATSSMYEDLKGRRLTEIDYLQGHVSMLGRRVGVATPISDRIVELIRGLEERGEGLVVHRGEEIWS